MSPLHLPRLLLDEMVAHARALYPEEVCGLLAGRDNRVTRLYLVENIRHSPVAFEMEPLEQIRAMLAIEAEGLELLAIYHSHPHGPARPSATDVALAFYPDQVQLIVSLAEPEQPAVGAFAIRDGQIADVAWAAE